MVALEPRAVGRPKKSVEAMSTRLEEDAYELARQASAIFGESITVYASRVVRERANADLLESARKRIKEADKPGKKGGAK